MALEEQIKRAIATGEVVIGSKETERALLFGKAKYVFYSEDLEDVSKERFEYLLKLGKVPNKELKYTYRDLGQIIGKDYPVGALAVIVEGKAKIEL